MLELFRALGHKRYEARFHNRLMLSSLVQVLTRIRGSTCQPDHAEVLPHQRQLSLFAKHQWLTHECHTNLRSNSGIIIPVIVTTKMELEHFLHDSEADG